MQKPQSGQQQGRVLSRAFEIRAVSHDPAADGETDFHEGTSVLSTEERIALLERMAAEAGDFFDNPEWDRLAVPPADVAAALRQLKPLPRPAVRVRRNLNSFRWNAWRPAHAEALPNVPRPHTSGAIECKPHAAHWKGQGAVHVEFPPQDWRFVLRMKLARSANAGPARIVAGRGCCLDIDADGLCRIGNRELPAVPGGGERFTLRMAFDLSADGAGVSLRINDTEPGHWVSLADTAACGRLEIQAGAGWSLYALAGIGFDPQPETEEAHSRDIPYLFRPLFREEFLPDGPCAGWQEPGFDDSAWKTTTLPAVRGGILEAGEDLFLRKTFIPGASGETTLDVESLDPGGEIWINGRLVSKVDHPQRQRIPVGAYLIPGRENTLALRVYHRRAYPRMRHTSADRYTGWSAGRVALEEHAAVRIDDLFVVTRELSAESATLDVEIQLSHTRWGEEELEPKADTLFGGYLELTLAPWFPEEQPAVKAAKVPVRLRFGEQPVIKAACRLANPQCWTVERPFLYAVRAVLHDDQDSPVDDVVVTTGVRTVSQEGGVFRLNGQPAMMLGGLIFGTRAPIELQSKCLKRGRLEHLVRDILLVRAMGGNTLRMSVHDGPYGGINDPRLAEAADQLGVLFQWTTHEWIRTGSPWQLSFDRLAADIRQVRNHPSIVMWQPGNHPKFESWQTEGARWYTRIVETITAVDTSRLIAPTSNMKPLHAPSDDGRRDDTGAPIEPVPAWTHPLVVRGSMDTPTGYGLPWEALRRWPAPRDWDGEQGWLRSGYRSEYLASERHAYFDFESEESAAQPRWDLHRGEPYYRRRSYELYYDRGSIGRDLAFEEWRISQAWQAFSAYEAYRKKRWLDYDGMAWCTLDGGANSGTYEKPVTDTLGYAKMAWYALRMAFQPLLAGSSNVDVVYGPGDRIEPFIAALGEERRVDLTIEIRDARRTILARKKYPAVSIPAGRRILRLPPWELPALPEGCIAVHYTLTAHVS